MKTTYVTTTSGHGKLQTTETRPVVTQGEGTVSVDLEFSNGELDMVGPEFTGIPSGFCFIFEICPYIPTGVEGLWLRMEKLDVRGTMTTTLYGSHEIDQTRQPWSYVWVDEEL